MRKALNIAVATAVAAAGIALSGCHHRQRAQVPRTPSAPAPIVDNEEGLASWYGHPYHGRPAANGEIYDMEKMTAAHRTLPFETWVRVHNLDNGKTVDVRITDRGPFVDGRIIDLSHAAARSVEMIGPGTARVRLEILSLPAALAPARFAVQVGAFQHRENAERLRIQMENKYGVARLVQRSGNPVLWRVLVGQESSTAGAAALAARIQADSGGGPAGFVVRIDSI